MIEYVKARLPNSLRPSRHRLPRRGIRPQHLFEHIFSPASKQEAKLYVYEAIREDAYVLYGFSTRQNVPLPAAHQRVGHRGQHGTHDSLRPHTGRIGHVISSGNDKLLKTVKGIG